MEARSSVHDFAAVSQNGEIFETFGQRAQLRVVETAGALLAIARDEGDGCAFLDQLDRSGNLAFADGQFLCDDAGDFGDDAGIFAGHVFYLISQFFGSVRAGS